jgi:ribonuclease D
VIDSDAKMRAAVQSLVSEKILGFDTETRPAFKKGESYPPSLIQLAAGDRVYIFQLRHIKSYDPIASILNDKRVLKAGIAVDDDIAKMNDLFSLGSSGFVELAEMAHRAGIKNAGLRGL